MILTDSDLDGSQSRLLKASCLDFGFNGQVLMVLGDAHCPDKQFRL